MLHQFMIMTLAALPALAADGVSIEKVKVNGTGCRPDTVAVAVSADRSAFTVIYSDYLARAGAGGKTKDERRTCSITVRLTVPPSTAYAITAVDHRGFAHLESGASATMSARYHLTGTGAPAYTTHAFAAGLDDSWQVTDPPGSAVASACGGGKLDIDTELRAQADRADVATSFISMDSTDAAVADTYHLTYRAC
ncbi:DUF4360 domain-containing protein [Actinoplanes sp. NPDC049316]|uniref:DUF4360 domain-containing protein n=1 Tax=Actinoplanes sp. NPDC049316 TaxID=3154727 RepID=UPI003441CB2D